MNLDMQPRARLGLIYKNGVAVTGEAIFSLCHHLEDPHRFDGKHLLYSELIQIDFFSTFMLTLDLSNLQLEFQKENLFKSKLRIQIQKHWPTFLLCVISPDANEVLIDERLKINNQIFLEIYMSY